MTKANASSSELQEIADMLVLGVDTVLWCLPAGIVRLVPDDLPTIRAFLADEIDTVSFPIVCLNPDAPMKGGGR